MNLINKRGLESLNNWIMSHFLQRYLYFSQNKSVPFFTKNQNGETWYSLIDITNCSLKQTRPVWTGFKIAVTHKLLDYIPLIKKAIVNIIALL